MRVLTANVAFSDEIVLKIKDFLRIFDSPRCKEAATSCFLPRRTEALTYHQLPSSSNIAYFVAFTSLFVLKGARPANDVSGYWYSRLLKPGLLC